MSFPDLGIQVKFNCTWISLDLYNMFPFDMVPAVFPDLEIQMKFNWNSSALEFHLNCFIICFP